MKNTPIFMHPLVVMDGLIVIGVMLMGALAGWVYLWLFDEMVRAR